MVSNKQRVDAWETPMVQASGAPLRASTGRRELWAPHLPVRPGLEKSLEITGGHGNIMGISWEDLGPWVAKFDQLTVSHCNSQFGCNFYLKTSPRK